MSSASRMQLNLNTFRFCIGVARQILNTGMRCSFGQVVFLVPNNTPNLKSLDQTMARFSIGVNHVIGRAVILTTVKVHP